MKSARVEPSSGASTKTVTNREGALPLPYLHAPSHSASRQRTWLSVPPSLATRFLVALGVLILFGLGAATVSAAPVSLLLSQSTAFAILGHSCGGIQEKA